ncbi:MAG: glutamine synthetase family protein [Candidatus Dormibacteria bacterium]
MTRSTGSRRRHASSARAPLELEELTRLVGAGEIDTVLVAFPDLHGRLVGKRVVAEYFLNDVLGHEGLHACDYLLAVDIDMNPLPGYNYASWDQGYGDVRTEPDLRTLRLVPWLERTAMVLCDVHTEAGDPVEVSPRRILQRQLERARGLGLTVKAASELEFYLFRESFETLADGGYRDLVPGSTFIEDYHIFQTSRDEPLIRQIRNHMNVAGVPVEFSKGECGRGQHEINLRYTEALEMADRHVIYKNGVKEIAALQGRAVTFMAKYLMAESGSSCHLHTSLWNADGSHSVMHDASGAQHMSERMRHYLGGLMATAREFSLLVAPNVNSYKRYRPDSWAPTAIAWGIDNRTCGYRIVGEEGSLRVENRIPGADANPYLALAAMVAGGLWGIQNRVEPPPLFTGNGYVDESLPRVPASLHEAVDAFSASAVAREVFGDDVHHHLLNTAVQELATFDHTVITDWELTRYFERI